MSDAILRRLGALADRYHVEGELGHGGMATVYLARDLKHDRTVAIKVLRPELAQAVGSERFLREINIAAQLQSPHILPLLDSGEADGLLYYVMPLRGGRVAARPARHARARCRPREAHAAAARGRGRPRARAPARRGASRHQARQRDARRAARACVMDFGVAKAMSDATAHHDLTSIGHLARHAGLHGARAGRRRSGHRSSRRHLLGRRPGVRDADRRGRRSRARRRPIIGARSATPPAPLGSSRMSRRAIAQIVMKCLEKDPASGTRRPTSCCWPSRRW